MTNVICFESLENVHAGGWGGGGWGGWVCFKKWLIVCANCSLESKSAVKTLLFAVNEPNLFLKCRRSSSLALALHDFKVKKRGCRLFMLSPTTKWIFATKIRVNEKIPRPRFCQLEDGMPGLHQLESTYPSDQQNLKLKYLRRRAVNLKEVITLYMEKFRLLNFVCSFGYSLS